MLSATTAVVARLQEEERNPPEGHARKPRSAIAGSRGRVTGCDTEYLRCRVLVGPEINRYQTGRRVSCDGNHGRYPRILWLLRQASSPLSCLIGDSRWSVADGIAEFQPKTSQPEFQVGETWPLFARQVDR